MPTLLVIDDEPNILLCFHRVFRDAGLQVICAERGEDGLRRFAEHQPDVTVLDLRLPDCSGIEVFHRLRRLDSRALVIFITAHGSTDTAIEAMKEGACDYLLKPLDVPTLRATVQNALRVRHMMHTPAIFAEENTSDENADVIIGRSPPMQAMYKAIGRVASQDIGVLLLGESGAGKELVARAIYHHSRRADRSFLAVNCAAIPETLLESELFGHEQGAFTGADRRRIGKFEQCEGGTLFLDEIGDLPPITQAKLLRVLQDQTFQRLGGAETVETDVRIIAATHRDLETMVHDGAFRLDLYFRLAGFTIHVPPLRERLDDLPELVRGVLRKLNRELGRQMEVIHDDALAMLAAYHWPGNVRELENVLQTSVLHASGNVLLPEFLPRSLLDNPIGDDESFVPATDASAEECIRRLVAQSLARREDDVYHRLRRRFDHLVVTETLRHSDGNQVVASRRLGITRNTLRAKLRDEAAKSGAAASEIDHDAGDVLASRSGH